MIRMLCPWLLAISPVSFCSCWECWEQIGVGSWVLCIYIYIYIYIYLFFYNKFSPDFVSPPFVRGKFAML